MVANDLRKRTMGQLGARSAILDPVMFRDLLNGAFPVNDDLNIGYIREQRCDDGHTSLSGVFTASRI